MFITTLPYVCIFEPSFSASTIFLSRLKRPSSGSLPFRTFSLDAFILVTLPLHPAGISLRNGKWDECSRKLQSAMSLKRLGVPTTRGCQQDFAIISSSILNHKEQIAPLNIGSPYFRGLNIQSAPGLPPLP